jgi:hypothetical protein
LAVRPSPGGSPASSASRGRKAIDWLATKDKELREQNKAKKDAAAAQAALHRQQAETQAAAYQVLFDAWFDEIQRECPVLLVKSRNLLPGGLRMMNDECLVATARHWGFSSEQLALTTHRLIWSRGRLSQGFQQLYLTDIRDVSYHKPMLGTGTLFVESAGRHSMEGLVRMKHAPQFRDTLLTMVHYAKQRPQRVMVHRPAGPLVSEQASLPAPPPATDKYERLKQLAELKDSGTLTEDEFQAEKAKILSS